ncbi:MAG: hypothetical protein RLZZ306_2676 [Bacteroidota bacterium]
MKRIIACLSLLITVMSCESDKFEYSPDELSGVFKPNRTTDLSASFSCVANPNASFGPSIKLEKVSDTEIRLLSKIYIWDPITQKSNESELATNLILKTHADHVDLTYKDKVVGDYRLDKVYSSASDNSKYNKGKILNIRIEDINEKRFLMFRGVKE